MSNIWSPIVARAFSEGRHSIRAEHWPGVLVCYRSPRGWSVRIALDRPATGYLLQVHRPNGWQRIARSKQWAVIAARCVDLLQEDGFAEFLAEFDDFRHLPRALAYVAAGLSVALPPNRKFRLWSRDDYPALAEMGNFRVVVDPTGRLYAVQWVRVAEVDEPDRRWTTQATGETLGELVEKSIVKAFDHDAPEADMVERFAQMVEHLPECAADGEWLVLPPYLEPRVSKPSRKREGV